MSIQFYQVLHIMGVAGILVALGAVASMRDGKYKKAVSIVHGISMLVVFVAGFGMLAKLGYGMPPGWALAKIVIWFVLGGLIATPRFTDKAVPFVLGGVPLLVGLAACLAIYKPF